MKMLLAAAALAAFGLLGQASALIAQTPAPALVVHMHNYRFDPAGATIHAGDTVSFVNDDEVGHTVTAADGSFDSQDIPAHATWTQTFAKAGVVNYTCIYHNGMKGTLTVISPS